MDGDSFIKPVDHPSHGTEATQHGVRFEDGATLIPLVDPCLSLTVLDACCVHRRPMAVGAGWAMDGTPARLSHQFSILAPPLS